MQAYWPLFLLMLIILKIEAKWHTEVAITKKLRELVRHALVPAGKLLHDDWASEKFEAKPQRYILDHELRKKYKRSMYPVVFDVENFSSDTAGEKSVALPSNEIVALKFFEDLVTKKLYSLGGLKKYISGLDLEGFINREKEGAAIRKIKATICFIFPKTIKVIWEKVKSTFVVVFGGLTGTRRANEVKNKRYKDSANGIVNPECTNVNNREESQGANAAVNVYEVKGGSGAPTVVDAPVHVQQSSVPQGDGRKASNETSVDDDEDSESGTGSGTEDSEDELDRNKDKDGGEGGPEDEDNDTKKSEISLCQSSTPQTTKEKPTRPKKRSIDGLDAEGEKQQGGDEGGDGDDTSEFEDEDDSGMSGGEADAPEDEDNDKSGSVDTVVFVNRVLEDGQGTNQEKQKMERED